MKLQICLLTLALVCVVAASQATFIEPSEQQENGELSFETEKTSIILITDKVPTPDELTSGELMHSSSSETDTDSESDDSDDTENTDSDEYTDSDSSDYSDSTDDGEDNAAACKKMTPSPMSNSYQCSIGEIYERRVAGYAITLICLLYLLF